MDTKDSLNNYISKTTIFIRAALLISITFLFLACDSGGEDGNSSSSNSSIGTTRAIHYFKGNNGTTGYELFKTDGTAANTVLVKDINTTNAGANSNPDEITYIGDTVYFTASDGINGIQLWKSDGTEAGTVMVKNLSSIGSTFIGALSSVNGTLFFKVNYGSVGKSLWKSDGTEAGTVIVKDLTELGTSSIGYLYDVNNTLFFQVNYGTTGQGLWKSNGTETGTILLKQFSSFNMLTNVNGTLMFIADDGTENGEELWKSNGTESGTVMIKNINTDAFATSYPNFLTNVNGVLFFAANDGNTGHELWKSNGTESGTQMVKDINVGPINSSLINFRNVNGTLFFAANDGTGRTVWKSDGTASGTMSLGISAADVWDSMAVNDLYYFLASAPPQLWVTDGTDTRRLTSLQYGIMLNVNSPSAYSYMTQPLIFPDGKLLFGAFDGNPAGGSSGHGYEPWLSDGTLSGTSILMDLFNGTSFGWGQ